MRVVELFAGIGAQRMALTLAGIPHEVVAISEIDRHALASYEAIWGDCPNLGDITKIERLPPCDLVTYSFPCLTGDSLVKTADGWRRIDEMDRPMRVWTKDGWQQATASVQTGYREVIDIEPMSGLRISATREHKFWTRKRSYPWDSGKRMNVREFGEPEWTEAKDLTLAHYLGYRVPDEEPIPYYGGLAQKYRDGRIYQRNALGPMMESEGFWWTVGRYIADGYVRTDGNAVLCIGYPKEADLDGIPLKFTVSREPTAIKAIITSVEFGAFCGRFGRGAENKHIPPEFHALPRNLAKAMLDGYLSGDGHFDAEKGQWSITTVSRSLALDLAGLIAYVHHRPSSIYATTPKPFGEIEGRKVSQKTQYTIRFHENGRKQDKAFYEEGWIWFPIRRIEVTGRAEPVFDISVEESHSFTANGMTVHNCQDLSLAGKRGGMAEGSGTRSGLVWEVARLLEGAEERPEWLLMENVPQVLTAPEWPSLLRRLADMGYHNKWVKADSSKFGSAQKRVRAFMVSRLNADPPDLPESAPNAPMLCLRDVMETERDERYIRRIPLDRIKWRQPKEGYRHPQSAGLDCPLMDASDPRMETRRIASEDSLCPAIRRGALQKTVEEEEERVKPLVAVADNLRNAPKGRKAVGTITADGERLKVAPSDRSGESTPCASIEGETFYSKAMLYSPASQCPTVRKQGRHGASNQIKVVDGIAGESIPVAEDEGESFYSRRCLYSSSSSSPTLRKFHGLDCQVKVVGRADGGSGIKVAADWDRPERPDVANRLYGEESQFPTLFAHTGGGRDVFVAETPEDGDLLTVNVLTPRECWRLMGFPEWAFIRASRVSSETQLYNQAGNSIVVEVLIAIFNAMFRPPRRRTQTALEGFA